MLCEKTPIHVRHSYRGYGGAQIDGKNSSPIINLQEGRPTPARKASHGATDDPALTNELLSDEGHRATLQPGGAGEVGPRNRSPAPDQIEDNAAINAASRFARGRLHPGKRRPAHEANDEASKFDPALICGPNHMVPVQPQSSNISAELWCFLRYKIVYKCCDMP